MAQNHLFSRAWGQIPEVGEIHTTSLLVQNRDQWGLNPQAAFDSWLEVQLPPLRLSSKHLYRTLWQRFLRWATNDQKIAILDVKAEHIDAFLSKLPGVKREQRERYQRVITTAFDDLVRVDPRREHPARNLIVADPRKERWRAAPDNQAKQFLTIAELNDLQSRLIAERDTLSFLGEKPTASQWKKTRDLALTALICGSGLKVGELLYLSVNCKVSIGSMTYIDTSQYFGITNADRAPGKAPPNADAIHAFKGDDRGTHRFIPIQPWVTACLNLWIRTYQDDVRRQADPPSEEWIRAHLRLFPAVRKLNRGSHGTIMHPATMVRAVSTWSSEDGGVGRPAYRLTPQKLRNTYGANLLENGIGLEDVERLMGYSEGAASAFRLAAAWQDFCATAPGPARDAHP